jgi:salicylate hydroxylase
MTVKTDLARPLAILIAGAGIGGLSAAIALRKAGHHVQVVRVYLQYNTF